MSKKVLFSWRHAIQQSTLNSTTKLVLFNLSIYMNDQGGGCFPSIGTQAKCTGLTERAVYTALKKAVDAGYLEKRKVFSGKIAHNNYTATTPEDTKIEGEPLNDVHPAAGSPLNDVQVPPESGSGVPLNDVHPNYPIELSKELSIKKTKAKKDLVLPDWMPVDDWDDFQDMRKKIKSPMTDRAKKLMIGKLQKMVDSGCDPGEILQQSILNNWKDVYKPKGNEDEKSISKFGGQFGGNRKPTVSDAVSACHEAIDRGEL